MGLRRRPQPARAQVLRLAWRARLAWLAALVAAAAGHATAACGDALPGPAARRGLLGRGARLAGGDGAAARAAGRGQALRLAAAAVPPAGQPLPATLVVDADMPAHRHGMNYKATVQALGEGRFEARGLLLHMPGRWRLLVDLPAAEGRPALRLSTETSVR